MPGSKSDWKAIIIRKKNQLKFNKPLAQVVQSNLEQAIVDVPVSKSLQERQVASLSPNLATGEDCRHLSIFYFPSPFNRDWLQACTAGMEHWIVRQLCVEKKAAPSLSACCHFSPMCLFLNLLPTTTKNCL